MDQQQTLKTINGVLTSLDDRIHKKIMRLQLQITVDIDGPVGASRRPAFDKNKADESINRMYERLEQFLLSEVDKIKELRLQNLLNADN